MFSIVLASLFCLIPGTCFALTMEYYTYNGFYPVVDTLTTVALIFSDANYNLIFGVILLGAVCGGIAKGVYSQATAGRTGMWSWVAPVVFGMCIHQAFIVPKGQLQVYDQVLNKTQAVGGIPDGLVMLYGTFNALERGMTDIVDTAEPVGLDYESQAGGMGFNMLLDLGQRGLVMPDIYIPHSLERYVGDCVLFASQTYGTPSLNDLNNNPDFMPVFQAAENPAVFTVFYKDDSSACPNGSGTWQTGCTRSCTQAYGDIQTYLSQAAVYNNGLANICADQGFDPTDPNQFNQCTAALSNIASYVISGSFNANQLAQQVALAGALDTAIQNYTPDASAQIMANRSTGTTMITQGINANNWIPIMRAVVTAITMSITPFLLAFIITPFASKIIMTITGFAALIATWGVTDALVHVLGMDMAYRAFNEVRQYQLGYQAIMTFSTSSLKAMGIFATLRQNSMILATLIVSSLGLMSVYALSSFAGSLTGAVAGGAGAGADTVTPEGKARKEREFQDAPAMLTTASLFSWEDRVRSGTNQMARRIGSGLGLGDTQAANRTGLIEGQSAVGSAAGTAATANQLGTTVGALAQQNAMIDGIQRGARSMNLSAGTAAQMGALEALQGSTRTQATNQMYEDMVQRGEASSVQDAASKHAQLQVMNDAVTLEAFGGDMRAARDFKMGNQQLAIGQQHAILDAAEAAGVNLKDYAAQTGFMNEMKKVGALDAFSSGKITAGDLRTMGETGLLTEAGRTDASRNLASMFGGSVRNYQDQLGTWEGMDKYTKYDAMQKLADSKGISLKNLMQAQHRSGSFAVDAAMAQKLGLAGAGSYQMSWDSKGGLLFTDQKSGRQYQVGTFGKTGSDIQFYDSKGYHYGTDISGVEGGVYLDYKKQTASGMIETGNGRFAELLTTGDRSIQLANQHAFAAGWSHEQKAFMEQKGQKYDIAQATGSVSAGFKALGMGASMEGKLTTGSKSDKNFDLNTSAMNMVIDYARETAKSRGLTEAQAIQKDVTTFHDAVRNEALHTKRLTGDMAGGPASAGTDIKNEVTDSAAPYPMASQGEQKRRVESAKNDLRKDFGQ